MWDKYHVVRNERSDRVLGRYIRRADTFAERLLGLTKERSVPRDTGLWIDRCHSIHTFGMEVPIDIYYLDAKGIVVAIDIYARPNRYTRICAAATSVLEIGTALDRDVQLGDRLVLT
jgi:uncharacterized membrane protein (UPF0127 family)